MESNRITVPSFLAAVPARDDSAPRGKAGQWGGRSIAGQEVRNGGSGGAKGFRAVMNAAPVTAADDPNRGDLRQNPRLTKKEA